MALDINRTTVRHSMECMQEPAFKKNLENSKITILWSCKTKSSVKYETHENIDDEVDEDEV